MILYRLEAVEEAGEEQGGYKAPGCPISTSYSKYIATPREGCHDCKKSK